ncbi:HlyD family efflux transporter periplasmic adaptor subunit [Pseudomonas fluorescens]|uniref:Type I secretion system membrane fusion protein PrsE n=1 Tax=Pseudomonas fluorescens TaxID=294 RepID=A0A5E7PZZ1_PSEFL|nr:HlyD family efflux transporter periplasmic adaptor subunit [Pseudomonas fluorescens]VVP55144.1 Type I secretion system membrane fusion protein PrsE [Pseudomonas fluorescens]
MKHERISLGSHLWAIVSITVLFVVLLVWATFSQIAQSSRAQGQVIAVARTQVVQAAIDGVISEMMVQEGQTVKKGELLVRLDRSQVEAAYNDSEGKVAALKATLARARAEVLGRPLQFPSDVRAFPNFMANQQELFQRRRSLLQADVSAMQKSLALVNEELALNLPLLATGDIGKTDIIRLKRQAAELEGQIASRKSKFFQDAQMEMTKAQEDLATQQEQLNDRKSTFERAEIYSPADALVKSIQTTTPGAKVRPGDVLLELVPTSGEFVIEAKLKPADVGSLRVGLPTSIKLDAYDYSIYGTLDGKVRYISPDALSERTPQGEVAYYRVLVDVDHTALDLHNAQRPDHQIEIQPGMTATVDIETGQHSILSYLTKPVSKTFKEALHER